MIQELIDGPERLQTGSDDRALPFQVEGLDVRGRVVTLGASIDAILQRHDFPVPVKRLVGRGRRAGFAACHVAEGRRPLHPADTDRRTVSLIVVDVRTPGQIRATATYDAERIVKAATAEGRFDRASCLARARSR